MKHPPLPWEQYDHPGRVPLGDVELDDRRQTVLLVLIALFITASSLLFLFGIETRLELSFALPGIGRTLPLPVALGALGLPLSFLCANLVCELYGRRRASLVVFIGLLVNLGLVGAQSFASAHEISGPLGRVPLHLSLAFVAFYVVANVASVQFFHWIRRETGGRKLWLRHAMSSLVGYVLGAIAFSLVVRYPVSSAHLMWEDSLLAGYGFAFAGAVLGTVPLYVCARLLSVFLRIQPAAAID